MSDHLNEFNTIFIQLSAQEVEFQDSVKTQFLAVGLTLANVESSLLTEEVNKKNLESNRGGTTLIVTGRSKDKKDQKTRRKGK